MLLLAGISLLSRGRRQQGDGRLRRSCGRRQRQPPVPKPGESPVGEPQHRAAHPYGAAVALVPLSHCSSDSLPVLLGGKRYNRSISLDHIVHETVIHPDGGLPHRRVQLTRPHNLPIAPPAVPDMAKAAPGQAAGQEATPRKDDRGISGREDQFLSPINTSESVEKTCGLSRKNEQPHGLTAFKLPITEIQYHRAGNRDEELRSEVSSYRQQPQTDCIVRESILRPDGGLPDRSGLLLWPPVEPRAEPALFSQENNIRKSFFQKDEGQASREEEFLRPHGLSMASSAVPGMAKVAAGPAAGPPTIPRKANHGMSRTNQRLESSVDTERSMGKPSGLSTQNQCPRA
ncbi:uncharacterized protein [Anser cygnoides]|uniref:uncharacterized protein isoform X1 n=1 Tax=Anser cygnoides TaxID=8845 RepID=UPI0034D1F1D5